MQPESCRHVHFERKLSGESDAHDAAAFDARHRSLAHRHVGKRLCGDVDVGESREQLAGSGAGDVDPRIAVGHRRHPDIPVGERRLEPVVEPVPHTTCT